MVIIEAKDLVSFLPDLLHQMSRLYAAVSVLQQWSVHPLIFYAHLDSAEHAQTNDLLHSNE